MQEDRPSVAEVDWFRRYPQGGGTVYRHVKDGPQPSPNVRPVNYFRRAPNGGTSYRKLGAE